MLAKDFIQEDFEFLLESLRTLNEERTELYTALGVETPWTFKRAVARVEELVEQAELCGVCQLKYCECGEYNVPWGW